MPRSKKDILDLTDHLIGKRYARPRSTDRTILASGLGTLFGGIFAGSPGMAIGGVVGRLFGGIIFGAATKPVNYILSYILNADQKERLASIIGRLVEGLDDVDSLIDHVDSSRSLRKRIVSEILRFLTNEFNIRLKHEDF